jgi:hypothetical protein
MKAIAGAKLQASVWNDIFDSTPITVSARLTGLLRPAGGCLTSSLMRSWDGEPSQ